MASKSYRFRDFSNGIKYIFYPIAFLVLFIGVFWVVASPIISPVAVVLKGFITDTPRNMERDVPNIFKDPDDNASVETIKKSDVDYPSYGDQFARLVIQSLEIDAPLFNGADPPQMRKGVGLYTGGLLPGYGGTVVLGAHNNTFFKNLHKIQIGDTVEIRTSYGVYIYEIIDTKSTRFDDPSAVDLTRKEENLTMYTCINWSGVGATPYRLFVYGKFISGPHVID